LISIEINIRVREKSPF